MAKTLVLFFSVGGWTQPGNSCPCVRPYTPHPTPHTLSPGKTFSAAPT
ncbi:hypothetical protein [Microcystis sp. LE19-195.1E]|nr:hypothetical protein [Microcystis sp. LE19-195.1E]